MTNPVGYEGEPLTLTDGRTVRLRYGMRGLMRLEDRFGSLAAVQGAISQDGTGAVFTPSVALIACGLLHEQGTPHGPLSNPEVLADLLDPARFQEAVTAAGKALQAAFPQAAQDAAPETPQPAPFPGQTGTTSPPSRSDAPMTSSGA